MSFDGYKDLIEEGDDVILYINFNVMYALKVIEKRTDKKGEVMENVFQTTFGALKVKDLIGKRFGSKVRLSRGYGFVLHPTPELWTKTLPHRTQIIYATDISLIIMNLELKPGSVVIESGTGSGSLSHSLIRTVAPNGHLHTFDFHEKRVETAQEEFKSHKVDHLVTARHRDVCADGFELDNVADAVFLDLPHPWDAIPHAKRALKLTGGRICSFSPCIEQVQKACEALRAQGFTEISTMECLLRELQVRRITMAKFDANWESKEVTESKKRKLEDSEATSETDSKSEPEKNGQHPAEDCQFVTGIPLVSMPGHTGYLTFATLPASKECK